MDEELKKAVADFYTPEELVGVLGPFTADEFLELIDTLEEKLLENLEEVLEEMNYDD